MAAKTVDTVTDPVGAIGDATTATIDITKSAVESTVDVVTDPVKAVGDVATATADVTMAAVDATVDITEGVAGDVITTTNAVVELSTSAIESTFELLGVNAAFQSVFGADLDKSDEGLEKAFKSVDADGSGKISSEEMRAYIVKVYGKSLDDKIVDAMMKAADTDGDGEVDLDEFKKIMRAGPDEK